MIRLVIVVILSLCFVVPAFAKEYKWIDGEGGEHYTDDITKVPLKQRPQQSAPKQSTENSNKENGGVGKKVTDMTDAEKQNIIKRLQLEWDAVSEHSKEEVKRARQKFDLEMDKIRQRTEDLKLLRRLGNDPEVEKMLFPK